MKHKNYFVSCEMWKTFARINFFISAFLEIKRKFDFVFLAKYSKNRKNFRPTKISSFKVVVS